MFFQGKPSKEKTDETRTNVSEPEASGMGVRTRPYTVCVNSVRKLTDPTPANISAFFS